MKMLRRPPAPTAVYTDDVPEPEEESTYIHKPPPRVKRRLHKKWIDARDNDIFPLWWAEREKRYLPFASDEGDYLPLKCMTKNRKGCFDAGMLLRRKDGTFTLRGPITPGHIVGRTRDCSRVCDRANVVPMCIGPNCNGSLKKDMTDDIDWSRL